MSRARAPGSGAPLSRRAWARAERASLLACLDDATRTGQHAQVIGLTAGIAGLLQRDGPWAEAAARNLAAIEAARQLGDRLGQAGALNDLGDVRWLACDYPAAAQHLEQALGLYRDLGERLGQANALTGLGVMRRLTDDYLAAARDLKQALAFTETSMTGSARPTPVTNWDLSGWRRVSIRLRRGRWNRRWIPTATSVTALARPTPSPTLAVCGGGQVSTGLWPAIWSRR
jgi:tetratricopeptide (TPR) repeat protein